MSNVFPVFIDSNTIFSFTDSDPASQFTIPEFVVKSSTNNYIMLKANEANVTINATSNISISSNTTFNADASFNANVTITGNNLVLGTSNTSANGYSKLPNGLLMQWGTVSASDTLGNIIFTIPFTTSLLSFTSTTATVNSEFNYTYTPVLIASNTTTANVRTSNSTTRNVTWMALGI